MRAAAALGLAALTAIGSAAAPVGALRAQTSDSTAGAILTLPVGARAVALGGAYTAVVGDEGSVFVNPAGMAAIRHAAVGLSYQSYLLGASLAAGGAAVRVGQLDLGLGLHVLDFARDTVPAPGAGSGIAVPGRAMATAYSAAAVGAAAYRFGMFSVGASAKYVKDHFADPDTTLYNASGFGFDVGGALTFFDIAAFGVAVQNLGAGLQTSHGTRAPLPRTVRAGFSLNIVDPEGATRLMVIGDWVSPRAADAYWAFGLEGGVVWGSVALLARAGIATGGAPADRRSAAFGGGLEYHNLRLDYGYQQASTLGGGSSRFGLRWVP